jgi:hypothetical protein
VNCSPPASRVDPRAAHSAAAVSYAVVTRHQGCDPGASGLRSSKMAGPADCEMDDSHILGFAGARRDHGPPTAHGGAESLPMPLPQGFGNNDVEGTAECFLLRETEDSGGAAVPPNVAQQAAAMLVPTISKP